MGSKNTSLKVLLLATACGFAFAGPASAADMQLKAPAVAAIPVSNWTGWYIGALAGVGTSQSSCDNQFNPNFTSDTGCNSYSPSGSMPAVGKSKPAGVFGVDAGYDWQSRYFVYGVAADWTWTNMKTTVSGASGSYAYQAKVDWLASFRGRMGLALDNTLVYVTGGLALGGVKDTVLACASCGDTTTFKHTFVGWVAGVGVEHRFTRNWSIKGEYLHYELGNHSTTFTTPTSTCVNSTPCVSLLNFNHTADVARIGLTYRP